MLAESSGYPLHRASRMSFTIGLAEEIAVIGKAPERKVPAAYGLRVSCAYPSMEEPLLLFAAG